MIVLSYAPVAEEIISEKLNLFLHKEHDWDNLFPNHPIRVGNEHPWAPYIQRQEFLANGVLDLSTVSETLFPAVTVLSSSNTEDPVIFADITREELLKDEFEAFKEMVDSRDYLISKNAIDRIEEHFNTEDSLFGVKIAYQMRDNINIDITTDDPSNIKNRIYDLCSLFLKSHGAFSLIRDENIEIQKGTISGNRSGLYNVDFGKVLRGATISCEVALSLWQVVYDTSAGRIEDIKIEGSNINEN